MNKIKISIITYRLSGHTISLIVCALLTTLLPTTLFSQTSESVIMGTIDNQNEVGNYTVTALCGSDTIRATYAEQEFSLAVSAVGKCAIVISAEGYGEYTTDITLDGPAKDLGYITLEPLSSVALNEVVVKGKRCKVTRDGTTYQITNIQGTRLGDAGSIMDMLQWTPGLRRDGSDGVRLTNGSTPVIYIDGRKADAAELKTRLSSDVAKIEVIKDPGARYSSSTEAVVNITLRKHLKDYAGANFMNRLSVGRRISDNAQVSLNTQTGKLATFWSLLYGNSRKKGIEGKQTLIGATDLYESLYDDMNNSWLSKSQSYDATVGLKYDLNTKSYLSMQYNGEFSRSKMDSYSEHSMLDGDTRTIYQEDDIYPKDNGDSNSINLGYNWANNGQSLDITGKYTRRKSEQERNTSTTDKTSGTLGTPSTREIFSKGTYDLYNFELNYSFKIKKANLMDVGVSTDYIDNETDYRISTENQDSRRKDFVQGAYLSWFRRIKGLQLNAQMRYEYTHSSITNLGAENTQSYSNVLPIVQAFYNFNGKTESQLVFSYRRFMQRPTITQLNNVVTYSDMLETKTGNPDLKSVACNKLQLNYNNKWMYAALRYNDFKDDIDDGTYVEEGKRGILKKPVNLKYYRSLMLDAGYYYSDDKIDLSITADVARIWTKYNQEDGLVNKNRSDWHADVYLDFSWNFYKTFEVFTQASYRSPYLQGTIKTGDMWGLDLGVKGSFLKKRLVVSVEGTDLLHRAVTPFWSSDFANVTIWKNNSYDTRQLRVTVTYRLNAFRSKYRNKDIGDDAKKRAQ